MKQLIAITLLLLVASPQASKANERLRIAVASNFLPTAQELLNAYTFEDQTEPVLISGSTGKLYSQITNGAPFDVFLSADARRPRRLVERGDADADSLFTYALGRLVLWSARPDLVDERGDILFTNQYDSLAIANPDLAPYGRAAQQVLLKLNIWALFEHRLVQGENIAQTYQFIHTRNAHLGLVARAQVIGHYEGSRWYIPSTMHDPIEQQAVRLSDKDSARAWLDFLKTDEAHAIIKMHGYDLPDAQ